MSSEKLEQRASANDGEAAEISPPPPEQEYPATGRMLVIMIGIILCIFLVALDLTIVATAIPRITDEFHSLDQVGWYGSAFFLALAAFQAPWGKVYKYFDLKLVYLVSIFVFEVGSLICGVSQNSITLIVGRAIAGMGGAGLSAGGYTIIAFTAPPRQRPILIGLVGITFVVASVLGPLLGGIFTENTTWRWCFYVNLPIGGVAAAVILFFFRTPAAARPAQATWREKLLQLDMPGTVIILTGTVCYLLAMQWGGTTKAWNSADVIGVLVAFSLLAILFIFVEYFSGSRALLVGRILKDRTIMALCAYIFFAAGMFATLLYYFPIYFQATRGVSAEKSGIDNLPLVLGAGLFSMISGGFITGTGLFVPVLIAGSTLAVTGTSLIYTLAIDSPSAQWIGYQAVAGIAIGLFWQVPPSVAQSIMPPEDISTAIAIILFFQTFGAALFVSAAQAGFANRLLERLPTTAPGVDVQRVLLTGATELRGVFAPEQIPGILAAYMDGLRVPWIIGIACACVTFVLAWLPRWENIKGKNPLLAGA